jgi:hypothetical protein
LCCCGNDPCQTCCAASHFQCLSIGIAHLPGLIHDVYRALCPVNTCISDDGRCFTCSKSSAN